MAKRQKGESGFLRPHSKVLFVVSEYHGNQKGGVSLEGLNIQAKLKRLRLTQRWLLDQLHGRGFVELRESTLSSILTGAYKAPLADSVISASEEILKSQES